MSCHEPMDWTASVFKRKLHSVDSKVEHLILKTNRKQELERNTWSDCICPQEAACCFSLQTTFLSRAIHLKTALSLWCNRKSRTIERRKANSTNIIPLVHSQLLRSQKKIEPLIGDPHHWTCTVLQLWRKDAVNFDIFKLSLWYKMKPHLPASVS